MSNRENRIASAVDSLITHVVPSDPEEDEAVAQERYDSCFELVSGIINGFVLSPFPPFTVAQLMRETLD